MNSHQDTQSIKINSLKISLASPEDIKKWSYGEVKKPETINYRSLRPEKDGLFCEKIFGPTKDFQCYCGKYKGIRYKGVTCDKCGVLLSRSVLRRERMGHIDLAVPVTHLWFLRNTPSTVSLILDMSVKDLERVNYFANFIVVSLDQDKKKLALEAIKQDHNEAIKDLGDNPETAMVEEIHALYQNKRTELTNLNNRSLLTESQYRFLTEHYSDLFKASIGAEAILELLKKVDISKCIEEIKANVEEAQGQKKKRYQKRLRLFEGLGLANIKPEWMIIHSLPVIPPDLRPMVQLDGGRFATSDLNDLYRRVINRNNRLKRLKELDAPEVICRNEKRMLQEAVDALIDNNARREKMNTAASARKRYNSLTDLLKGKKGRFRQNLLGKRVDYSGRSVIVVGPDLRIDQCGLPKTMAMELFRPFVVGKLISDGITHNVRSANRMIEVGYTEIWDALEEVIKGKYVLLNRAPTLHRLGIQAFKPILVEGKAIRLHPLICAAFNADFDGDTAAVHLPLSAASQWEAENILLSKHNLLKPASGDPIISPSNDIVIGIYFLTTVTKGSKGEGKYFANAEQAIIAHDLEEVALGSLIKILIDGEIVETTVGRIIFNQILPPEIGFVNRELGKAAQKEVLAQVHESSDSDTTARVADNIKDLGFHYASISGLSISMGDMDYTTSHRQYIGEAEKQVVALDDLFEQGLISSEEKHNRVVAYWQEAVKKVEKELKTLFQDTVNQNALSKFVGSGSKGNFNQINQISGMIGMITDSSGGVVELPIKSNYKTGLNSLEYFVSCHGARKGLVDTALRTAESGYMTRKLVDVAQDQVIKTQDCGDDQGYSINKADTIISGESKFMQWIEGRMAAQDLAGIVKKGDIISAKQAKAIEDQEESFNIRSILSCKLKEGICANCYGIDLARGAVVKVGEPVGIIAAQSIGEPGTQLTMRTIHSGGVFMEDITQGLPRVEEIFEVRNPKGEALLADINGTATIVEGDAGSTVRIETESSIIDSIVLQEGDKVKAKNGAEIKAGAVVISRGKEKIFASVDARVQVLSDRIDFLTAGFRAVEYTVAKNKKLLINDGQKVSIGDQLTEGSLNLQDLMRLKNKEAVQRYVIREIQAIYFSQGERINSKHIELIIRRMFSRIRVTDVGDSKLVTGEIVSIKTFQDAVEQADKDKKEKPTGELLLMPISRISVSSDSWLAAASFQETTKVLINSSLNGRVDYLRGLKENVIIGQLIPAGTGLHANPSGDDNSMNDTSGIDQ